MSLCLVICVPPRLGPDESTIAHRHKAHNGTTKQTVTNETGLGSNPNHVCKGRGVTPPLMAAHLNQNTSLFIQCRPRFNSDLTTCHKSHFFAHDHHAQAHSNPIFNRLPVEITEDSARGVAITSSVCPSSAIVTADDDDGRSMRRRARCLFVGAAHDGTCCCVSPARSRCLMSIPAGP